MASAKKTIKVIAIIALIVVPVTLIYFLATAKWVHEPLPYLGNSVKDASGKEIHHSVEDIHLWNQFGKKVTLDSLKNKIIVANIFFASCPDVCPEMNKQVQVIAEKYSEFPNVAFLSVSIDPERDSVKALYAYSRKYNPKIKNWWFCTGNKSEIYDWVLNDILLANELRGENFIHDDKVVIIDKQRHIRSILATRPPEDTPDNRRNSVKLGLIKNINDDIDNLLYEYRQQELDK
ncbi:MAG: SCO family protein [Bacteroidetes bacterium]|nr:SCO family protein [Bacteroidota bacterium]